MTRRRRKRPRGSGRRPSGRPRSGGRRNTVKWKRNERRCDRRSETRSAKQRDSTVIYFRFKK